MKHIYSFSLIFLLPILGQAAPTTIYRSVEHYPSYRQSAPVPYSAERSVQWYKGDPNAPAPRPRYPARRPQVLVVTPHVDVQVYPQTQQHYESTEEVHLPQGGTYRRSVTTDESSDSGESYGQPKVIFRGNVDVE